MKQLLKRIRENYNEWMEFSKQCPKCKRRFVLEYSSLWNGGWNHRCNQACARAGKRCFECGHIEWDLTDEEYEKQLPEWCTSNSSKL